MGRLCRQIESLRIRMMKLAEQKGLGDDEVVRLSQQLDVLILRYEVLTRKKKIEHLPEAI